MAKTAIVTGSSRGIGRAIAEKLGSQGFNVVVNYAGNKTEADKVAAAVEAAGGSTIVVQANGGIA
jgi:3-oxoacyl-[acyl-carrier protein] reductase